jgi:peptidoglycan-associated lipoprotein
MSRKSIVWVALPVLAVLLVGCPKKKPEPVKEEIKMDTTKVEPPTQEMPAAPAPPPADEQEVDPLASEDLRLVNEEARRLGFAESIYFDFDKADLKPEGREALAGNAQFLKAHAEFILTIEGHCDERDTNEYNLALGERRASATRAYLSSLGIAADRLSTISYGEERPVCTQSEESCWWQNRRAHMLITGRTR